VLSVGGVKEKVMAAQRANIKTVVLPEGNRKDLTEVPDEVKEGLNFVFAARVEDVWRETLIPGTVARPSARKDDAEYKPEHPKSDDRPEQR
jgi:ATP-dependent Lon protease